MREFHKIWIDQCDGARNIKDAFGVEKALGYLIGEKLLNFMRAAEQRPEFAAELPSFIAEIREMGCELKDIDEGLIDFRSIMDGREVYLCWKNGEDYIGWWHEIGSGFSSRQPLEGRDL